MRLVWLMLGFSVIYVNLEDDIFYIHFYFKSRTNTAMCAKKNLALCANITMTMEVSNYPPSKKCYKDRINICSAILKDGNTHNIAYIIEESTLQNRRRKGSKKPTKIQLLYRKCPPLTLLLLNTCTAATLLCNINRKKKLF